MIKNKKTKKNNWNECVEMLNSFYYEKNGKESTIEFLVFILNKLINE